MESSNLKDKRSWATAFVVFVCGVIFLELFIRSFVYRKTKNEIHIPDLSWETPAGTHYFQAIEGYGNTYYVANDEIATPFTNGISVVVLGDSYTEGLVVNDDDKYVSIAEKLLHERGIDADLHNFGKSGTHFADEIWFFKYIYPRYKPKIAVFQLNFDDLISENNNDNTDHLNYFIKQSDGSLQIQHQPLSIKSPNELLGFLAQNFSFFGYGNKRFEEIKSSILDNNVAPDNTTTGNLTLGDEATILEKISILQHETAGVKLVIILTPPFPALVNHKIITDNLQYDELVTLLRKIPDLVVIDPSVSFVNLLRINQFPSGFDNSFPGFSHWNKYGNEIVGQLLAGELQDIMQ
jgi:hypothetical protein